MSFGDMKRRVGRLRPLPCPACRGRPTLARPGTDASPCLRCQGAPDALEEVVVLDRGEVREAIARAEADGAVVLGALAYLG